MLIYFTRQAAQTVSKELRLYPDLETGGVLFGIQMKYVWIVLAVSSSGNKSMRTPSGFDMCAEEMNHEANTILEESFIPIHVLGIWHKHNHRISSDFSYEDKEVNRSYAQLNTSGIVSILALKGDSSYSFHAVHVSRKNNYHRAQIIGLENIGFL